MHAVDLQELDLFEGWADGDETLHMRAAFPFFHATGAKSSSAVYFELDPGKRLGTHTDSAEEIVVVLEGTAEATVGGERGELRAGSAALVPALVPHDVANAGDTTLRALGFFSSNAVVSVFEHSVEPIGRRVLGTPVPEEDESTLPA